MTSAQEEKLVKVFELLAPPIQATKLPDDSAAVEKSTVPSTSVPQSGATNTDAGSSTQAPSTASQPTYHWLSRADKLTSITTLSDCLVAETVTKSSVFARHLVTGTRTLVELSDDANQDVRIAADEALNKIIKLLKHMYANHLLYNLFLEVKRNGPPRSLSSALKKFADLVPHIKPFRCRTYAMSLRPVLVVICEREEESIQEALIEALPKLAGHLFYYVWETENKELLKSILPRLHSESIGIRRTTAEIVAIMCRYSRQPIQLVNWALEILIDIIVPVDKEHSAATIHGVLLAIRHLIVCIDKLKPQAQEQDAEQIRQELWGTLLEICLFYSVVKETSLATAALEALVQLLRTAPVSLINRLTRPGGCPKTTIYKTDVKKVRRSERRPSECSSRQNSITTLPVPPPLPNPLDPPSDDPSLIPEVPPLQPPDDTDQFSTLPDVPPVEAVPPGEPDIFIQANAIHDDSDSESDDDEIDIDLPPSVIQLPLPPPLTPGPDAVDSPTSPPLGLPPPAVPREGTIGSFTDTDEPPLLYLVRLLSRHYLLPGGAPGVIAGVQGNPRISLRVAAIQAIAKAVSFSPGVLLNTLLVESRNTEDLLETYSSPQLLTDLVLYCRHDDPQMRGQTCLLLACFLQSWCTRQDGFHRTFKEWSGETADDNGDISPDQLPVLDSLIELLAGVLNESGSSSGVSVKFGLQALGICASSLLASTDHQASLRISMLVATSIGRHRHHNYRLVRKEVLSLVDKLDWSCVRFVEKTTRNGTLHLTRQPSLQDVCLDTVFSLLEDTDPEVRSHAVEVCGNLIPSLSSSTSAQQVVMDSLVARMQLLVNKTDYTFPATSQALLLPLLPGLDSSLHISPLSAPTSTAQMEGHRFEPLLHLLVSRIVNNLLKTSPSQTEKNKMFGSVAALSHLIDRYPPLQFPVVWGISLLSTVSPRDSCTTSLSSSGNPLIPAWEHNIPPSTANQNSKPTPTNYDINCITSLLTHSVALMTSSPSLLDLQFHIDLLQLTSKLLNAYGLFALLNAGNAHQKAGGTGEIPLSEDSLMTFHSDQFLKHLAKILSIYWHIIEDQTPSIIPNKVPISTAQSPIKKKRGKDVDQPNSSILKPKQKDKEIFEKDNKTGKTLGFFAQSPHYQRLFDVLRVSYQSYKISQDPKPDKTIVLLESCLGSMCRLFELMRFAEVASHTQELLVYLNSVYTLEPILTVRCVAKLLRSIFGTNLASQWDLSLHSVYSNLLSTSSAFDTSGSPKTNSNSNLAGSRGGSRAPASQSSFSLPLSRVPLHSTTYSNSLFPTPPSTASLSPSNSVTTGSSQSTIYAWQRKAVERRVPIMLRIGKGDKPNLSTYIRLFEPIVIRTLRHFSLTCCEFLQKEILEMLCQLIHLRINYYQLDAEQRFLDLVLKQFEIYEQGHFHPTCSTHLIPAIFQFLLLLSYEPTANSPDKPTVSLATVLRSAIAVHAGGFDPEVVLLPALCHLVSDLYVRRSAWVSVLSLAGGNAEVDVQREHLINFLLTHVPQYGRCWTLLALILQSSQEQEDKWKRLSRQIMDPLLPSLAQGHLRLDSQSALNSLHNLFKSMSSVVFRPIDPLLKILFAPVDDRLTTPQSAPRKDSLTTPTPTVCPRIPLERWMAGQVVLLGSLLCPESVCQCTEEVVLTRIGELGLTLDLSKRSFCERRRQTTSLASSSTDFSNTDNTTHSPEHIFARFLFQLVGILSSRILENSQLPSRQLSGNSHSDGETVQDFLISQLVSLQLTLLHIFTSDHYRRTTQVARQLMTTFDAIRLYSVEDINCVMFDLVHLEPYLTVQWCQILSRLGYEDKSWWAKILRSPLSSLPLPSVSSHLTTKAPNSSDESDVCLDELGDEREEGFQGTFRRSRGGNGSRRSGRGSGRNAGEWTGGSSQGSMNAEIVKRAAFLLYCQYVCDHASDAAKLSWIIMHHSPDLIANASEPIIQDLIGAIHRNPSASKLFVQAFNSRCGLLTQLPHLRSALRSLEGLHLVCTGRVIILLFNKFILPPQSSTSTRKSTSGSAVSDPSNGVVKEVSWTANNSKLRGGVSHCLSLVRRADTIICRRIEMLLSMKKEDAQDQLALSEVEGLQSRLTLFLLRERFPLLSSLLRRLKHHISPESAEPCTSLATVPSNQSDLGSSRSSSPGSLMSRLDDCYLDDDDLKNIVVTAKPDETWFLSRVRWALSNPNNDPRLTPRLLQQLSRDQITTELSKAFNLTNPRQGESSHYPPHLLELCIRLGFVRTLAGFQRQLLVESDTGVPSADKLFEAVCSVLFSPNLHARTRRMTSADLCSIASALNTYLAYVRHLPVPPVHPDGIEEMVTGFLVICVQSILNSWNDPLLTDQTLSLILSCLTTSHIHDWVSREASTLLPIFIDFVYDVVFNRLLTDPSLCLPISVAQDSISMARVQIGHLIQLVLAKVLDDKRGSLKYRIKMVIIGLARLGMQNSLALRMPNQSTATVVDMGSSSQGDVTVTDEITQNEDQLEDREELDRGRKVPIIPDVDVLGGLDRDELGHSVGWINLVGWTSRHVFEETWIAFLALLNQGLYEERIGEDSDEAEDKQPLSQEELVEQTQCLVKGIRGVTSLLLSATSRPQPGNPLWSRNDHKPRDKVPNFLHTRYGSKLSVVHSLVEEELHGYLHGHPLSLSPANQNSSWNLEREGDIHGYQHGQISLDALIKRIHSGSFPTSSTASPMHQNTSTPSTNQSSTATVTPSLLPTSMDIDLVSCLQSVPILHHQWLHQSEMPNNPNQSEGSNQRYHLPLALVCTALQSAVLLADLFTAKDQLQWLLDSIIAVGSQICGEDDLLQVWIVTGLTKCVAALDSITPVREVTLGLDMAVTWTENALRSPLPSLQDAGLHSAMTLLQMEPQPAYPELAHLHSQVMLYLEQSLSSFLPPSPPLTPISTPTSMAGISLSSASSFASSLLPSTAPSLPTLTTSSLSSLTQSSGASIGSGISMGAQSVAASISASANAAAAAAQGAVSSSLQSTIGSPISSFYSHLERHQLTVLAATFFYCERHPEAMRETDLLSVLMSFAKYSITGPQDQAVNDSHTVCFPSVYHALFRGLERLLLTGRLPRITSEVLMKLSLDRLKASSSPHLSVPALGLFLTCAYTSSSVATPLASPVHTAQHDPSDASRHRRESLLSTDLETQLVLLERTSRLFDRLRTSCVPPPTQWEVRLLTRVLPQLLLDFFPHDQALNKTIAEFVGHQQAYPVLSARMLYEIFTRIMSEGREAVVHEWVLLSMRSLLERTPLSLATWSTTVFLIASSTNPNIRAAFPQCLDRLGRLEEVDVELLCLAGVSFVTQGLSMSSDRSAFISALSSKTHLAPFNTLLITSKEAIDSLQEEQPN